jgi:hypothetical protein
MNRAPWLFIGALPSSLKNMARPAGGSLGENSCLWADQHLHGSSSGLPMSFLFPTEVRKMEATINKSQKGVVF